MRANIQNVCRVLDRAAWAFAMLLLAIMTVLVIGELFARYLFNSSTTWTEELTRYLMVWMTFIGASSAIYRGELAAVTYLNDRLPQALRRIVVTAGLMLMAAFLATAAYQGYELVQRSFVLNAAALQVPMAWVYLAIPVGSILMLIQTLGLMAAPPESAPLSSSFLGE